MNFILKTNFPFFFSFRKALLFIIAFFVFNSSFAQTNEVVGKKYIFEFRDGTVIIGVFEKKENGNIYIKSEKGEDIYIPSVMIAQSHEVTNNNLRNGEYWFPNLHNTRYYFAPSAFGLREGEGYFSNVFGLLWQVQFGITDDFSLGAGSSIIGFPATWNAKYCFNVFEDLNSALGYFWVGDLFNILDNDNRSFVSMPYAVFTKGSKENNLTLGLGYNLADSWIHNNRDAVKEKINLLERVTLNAGGTVRLSRRFSFIFEGWLFNVANDPTVLGGPGFRYFRKVKRVTAKNGAGAKTLDLQFLTSPDLDGTIIPMIGTSMKF